jgi:predicted RNase H-like nuclease (RuvC/YqgF family)
MKLADSKPNQNQEPAAYSPWKTIGVLAIGRFLIGEITENVLAKKLDMDRLEARATVVQFLNTAIANAQVPIERISTLENRLANLTAQVSRLDLDRASLLDQITAEQSQNHDLRNKLQRALFEIEELRQDLESERRHVIELSHLAEYVRQMAGQVEFNVPDGDGGQLTSARLYLLAGAEQLTQKDARS